MNRFVADNRSQLRQWLVLLAVAGLVITPAIIYGIPDGPDLRNHFRLALGFERGFAGGYWYPSWIATSNSGYGDASLRIYPPGLYFILNTINFVLRDWYASWLSGFALITLLGGIGAYFWARSISQAYALWAGIFYMLAPYHINELYQAALLAEYLGGAALAFVFGFLERFCQHESKASFTGLAISFALLIFAHPPLAMMGTILLAPYFLLRCERHNLRRRSTLVSLALLLGLALSAPYWTTMLGELSWVKGDRIDSGIRFNINTNFLFSNFSADNPNTWWANLLAAVTLVMLWPAFLAGWINRRLSQFKAVGVLCLLTLFSILMVTPLSRPLWEVIPKLKSLEFPWRWLSVTTLLGAIALSGSLSYWTPKVRQKSRALALLAIGSVLVAASFSFLQPVRGASFFNRAIVNDLISSVPKEESLPEWLPVWANRSLHLNNNGPLIEAQDRQASPLLWEPERRVFRVTSGKTSQATLRTFFYPLWTATVNNRNSPLTYSADGLIQVPLPPEESLVVVEFVQPLRVRVAEIISVLSLLLISVVAVIGLPAKRRSVVPTAQLTAYFFSPSAEKPAEN